MVKEIGFDFGTTNTVISYVNKKGKLLQLFYEGKKIFERKAASQSVTKLRPPKAILFIYVKRILQNYFWGKISTGIENKLIKEFCEAEGVIDGIVITVPANFSSTENTTPNAAKKCRIY